jgi:glycosyltransferase involved in cell wall biosynthesis
MNIALTKSSTVGSKLVILPQHDQMGGSSRLRLYQYVPAFENAGLKPTTYPLISSQLLKSRYKSGKYPKWQIAKTYLKRIRLLLSLKAASVVLIEKELFRYLPFEFEKFLLRGKRIVLDYDDAVFHNYDTHPSPVVKKLLKEKISRLMKLADCVVVGNPYLRIYAENSGAKNIVLLPTVVDLAKYQNSTSEMSTELTTVPRIVWIGSPSTVKYLEIVKPALEKLFQKTQFILRVIGGVIDLPKIKTEIIPWDIKSEVKLIKECQIGIMPLTDSAWERGKCGFKLIQYMACGLPTVGSPIGINSEIIDHEKSGFLASNISDWVKYLERLLSSVTLRNEMGLAGLKIVEQRFTLNTTGPVIIEKIKQLTMPQE